MNIRRLAAALLICLATVWPAVAAEKPAVSVLYLSRAGDPDYAVERSYAGLALRDPKPAIEGARIAMKESRIRGRALGLDFRLDEQELAPGADAVEAVRAAAPRAVILDLPLAEMTAVVDALGTRDDLILFNPRHPDDALRAAGCAPALLHTLPSRAMLADALAQFLAVRNWREVLVLAGPNPASAASAEAFTRAAGKFGLEIAGTRQFELSNDPRRRDLSNVALLTGDADYDVVYLADDMGEFGRYVPYATYLPRPVVGSEGLRPVAWHWTFERHGAPQLNQRFEKAAGRHMEPTDWAAWAAVRAVVEAVTRTGSTDIATLRAFMQSADFALDLYKGAPGGFRDWDGQLRQPVLLALSNAVAGLAPFDQFLHQTNTLDTLGPDRPEAACPRRAGG